MVSSTTPEHPGHRSSRLRTILFGVVASALFLVVLVRWANNSTVALEPKIHARLDIILMHLLSYRKEFGTYPPTLALLADRGLHPNVVEPIRDERYEYRAPQPQDPETNWILRASFRDRVILIDSECRRELVKH